MTWLELRLPPGASVPARAARVMRDHVRVRLALFLCWIVAAGWGVFFLTALAPSSVGYGGVAILHFVIGYVWGSAAVASPMTARLALFGTFLAGAFTLVALAGGTIESYFAWAGPLAAIALSDTTSTRNVLYSIGWFLAGFALLAIAFL